MSENRIKKAREETGLTQENIFNLILQEVSRLFRR